jgi:hypothetical protein
MEEERARALLRAERQRLERLLASVEADHDRVAPAALCATNRDLLASAQRHRQLLPSVPGASGGTTAALGGTAVDWSAASCCL